MTFNYYDANCLVKLVVKEAGSEKIERHLYNSGTLAFTTSFCFYEALGVLKAKWANTRRSDSISQEEYLAGCELLCSYIADEKIQLEEIPLVGDKFFRDAERLSEKHGIDLSDSFQLVTLISGMTAQLYTTIKPVLISEDTDLRLAASKEGLTVLSIAEL